MRAPAALASRITVKQPPETFLIKITARADRPVVAQQLADAWVRALAAEVQTIEAPGKKDLKPGIPRVTAVESAQLPDAPISPDIRRNTLIGLAAGLMLALGYAAMRSTLDRRLRTPADVHDRFAVPVVGEIPKSASLRSDADRSGEHARQDSAAAEAFRKLRTNLTYMNIDNPPRVVVVTSPQPGDGKSTVAAHIAAALQSTGHNVVLVDADLRRPSQAIRHGAEPSVGLTNVLLGQMDAESALQSVAGQTGLRLLASGPLPPNPSELLESQAWRSLIAELASRYFLVIDAPPLLPVTDAAILAKSSDGAFVVVSAGRTVDIELARSLEALDAVGAPTLGVVMNRLTKSSGYGYSYYYSYEPEPVARGLKGRRKHNQRPDRRSRRLMDKQEARAARIAAQSGSADGPGARRR
jgi:capsular exopolysaccharide synthesis family protein